MITFLVPLGIVEPPEWTPTEALNLIKAMASGDASALTIAMMEATGAENVIAANLEAYRVAIEEVANIGSLGALQGLINMVNETEAI